MSTPNSEEAESKLFISIVKCHEWIYNPDKKLFDEKKKSELWDEIKLQLQSYGVHYAG